MGVARGCVCGCPASLSDGLFNVQLDRLRSTALQQLVGPLRTKARVQLYSAPLKDLGQNKKNKLIEDFLAAGGTWASQLFVIANHCAAGTLKVSGPGVFFKGIETMLTWNGDFGVLDKTEVLGDLWPAVAAVVTVLKSSPCL